MRCAPLIACFGAACGSGAGLAVDRQCNPLGDHHCMTPWPASVFEVDDETTATGRRLAIPDGTLPAVGDDALIDTTSWNGADGWGASAPIIASFKGGISPVGLPPADNLDLSLATDSATVLLDMTTGERVAHYADLDPATHDVLLIHPAARLVAGHRYAVAITNRVTAADGEDLAVPAGFAALRQEVVTDHHLLEAARPRLVEALDALDDAGVNETDIVLAWDFTVASDTHVLDTLRDRALALRSFDVTLDRNVRRTGSVRLVTGTLTAPLVGGGTHRIAWRAIVPTSCAGHPGVPLGFILFGHSLLGDAREVDLQGELARSSCRVVIGTDLAGMTAADAPAIVRMLGELDDNAVQDTLAQGVLDQIALARALQSELPVVLAMRTGAVLDARDVVYYGASQLTAVPAAAPIARAVLTGDDPITSHVLDRYRGLLAHLYPEPLDATLAAAVLQMRWDPYESVPTVPVTLVGGTDPGTIWHARTLELPVLGPAPFTPWGLKAVDTSHTSVENPHTIRGYAPCCASPACAYPCSLPRLP